LLSLPTKDKFTSPKQSSHNVLLADEFFMLTRIMHFDKITGYSW